MKLYKYRPDIFYLLEKYKERLFALLDVSVEVTT